MKNTPIARELIDKTIEDFHITDFAKATIREVKAIAAKAEADSGVEFIKMEMGVPGLPPSSVGVKAEIESLQKGIASLYPDINGLPALKEEGIRQRRRSAGRMRTRYRFHARNFCLFPYMQPM